MKNPSMNYIRKVIINEVAKLLDEDYESIREIKNFANDVLMVLSKENYDEIVKNNGDLYNANLLGLPIDEIYKNSNKEYKKLKDFLTKTNIVIFLIPMKSKATKGDYSVNLSKKYDRHDYKTIRIYFDDSLVNILKDSIVEKKTNNRTIEPHDIYVKLYFKLISIVIHELQHAYDDYRSEGIIYNSKEFKQYLEKYANEEEIQDKEEELEKIQNYLKLPHEVWARFSQSMDKLRFTESNLEKNADGNHYLKYKMRPLKTVLNEFFYTFSYWASLYDSGNKLSKIQNRLIKAVVQFWHIEQEKIKEDNKNPTKFF